MLYLSVILFALAAVLGVVILISWLKNKEASGAVIYSHGAVAAVALVILIIFGINNPRDFPKGSIILFTIAAVAGFYMFYMDRIKKINPLALAFVHGLVAVSAFILLLVFILV